MGLAPGGTQGPEWAIFEILPILGPIFPTFQTAVAPKVFVTKISNFGHIVVSMGPKICPKKILKIRKKILVLLEILGFSYPWLWPFCPHLFLPQILPDEQSWYKDFLGKKLGGCSAVNRTMRFWTKLDEYSNFLQGPRIKKNYFTDPPLIL